jgi:Icc-related predicted phosphoesterase
MIRVAAVGDLHYARNSRGALHSAVRGLAGHADVLLLCGDLTDFGLEEEARVLAEDLRAAPVPVIAVLGNHDFEAGQPDRVRQVLADVGVRVLDGDSIVVDGVGIAGVKGFGGGFGRRALEPWGEDAIKRFVHEAVDEALKLERALARLHTPQRIAVLHYAPIRETVEGEAPEIFAFLGSTRLEEPINRFRVTAVFHGHSHAGRLEGRTSAGIPVYNVSAPLLLRQLPEQAPIRIVEIPFDGE